MSAATPWIGMEQALWTWLLGAPEVAALNLKTFRSYEGRRLAVNRTTLFAASDLPALAVEFGGKWTTEPKGSADGCDPVPFRLALIYAAAGGSSARAAFETAATKVRDRLLSPAARRSGLGDDLDDRGIAAFELRDEEVVPYARVESAHVEFWAWHATLVLVGNRSYTP